MSLELDSPRCRSAIPLDHFLYLLMRDTLPAGAVEELVREAEKDAGLPVEFTNGWLAQYAVHLGSRLCWGAKKE